MCVNECLLVCVRTTCVCPSRCQKGPSDYQELQLMVVVSQSMLVPGNKPKSSASTANALTPGSSLQPPKYLHKLTNFASFGPSWNSFPQCPRGSSFPWVEVPASAGNYGGSASFVCIGGFCSVLFCFWIALPPSSAWIQQSHANMKQTETVPEQKKFPQATGYPLHQDQWLPWSPDSELRKPRPLLPLSSPHLETSRLLPIPKRQPSGLFPSWN